MINDVEIKILNKICDERGRIMHMLKSTDSNFEQFGEIYFSTAYPGVVKGWHEHTKMTLNYAVLKGMIKLVLYDNREASSTYKQTQEIVMGVHNYVLVKIPPRIINGFKNVGTEECIIANCSSIPHDKNEIIRYSPYNNAFNYNWDLVFK
jgi:dTDP-4-dehydrorhamnose 3,5-epimerase